ncbi:MAG: cell wall metabolism sensor histidine kinase WalK [Gammaproteobacteria bacterium]|nr:cell wall metabolism sensor histidine kinase WalK [Gammaproteobacteria bacterium]NIW46768.1 hypothetical protein [Gammaproteobacteria bacterium]
MDELAQLAVSFNQMAAKLDKIENMRRQLIGDVAHELRTPLSTVKASIEGLIDGVLPAEVETFQRINRDVDRMQRLVHDLQELSQAEAGVYEMEFREIQIAEVVETTCERVHQQYADKEVDLILNVPSNLPFVVADKNRISQVLINLLGNALQYTPKKGSVTVSLKQRDEEVFVHIMDTGIGIPMEHLPLIFNRFYRVDQSRSRVGGGSGIGLTIAKHIIDMHGGRIWAESEGAGDGSTFSFSLPKASL